MQSVKWLRHPVIIICGAFLIVWSSCGQEDDYDFNAIIPVILGLSGPTEVPAHGLTEYPTMYRVPHRGGSSYNWQVGGHGGMVVLHDTYPNMAYITFNQSSDHAQATITVIETTMGGISSEPYSVEITLLPSCPRDMDLWSGEWFLNNHVDGNNHVAATPVLLSTDSLNMLRIEKFFDWVVVDFWEENWIPGIGGAGDFILEVDCDFPEFSGHFLLGETVEWTTYWMDYHGSFSPDNKTITIHYDIIWEQGGPVWNSFTATLSVDEIDLKTLPERASKQIAPGR